VGGGGVRTLATQAPLSSQVTNYGWSTNLWQFLLVLLIAAPTAAFVLTPTVVILVALAVFWIVELLFFLGLKPFSSKRVNEPPLVPKLS